MDPVPLGHAQRQALSVMPSKVCGMFPVRHPINVLRAIISLGRRSFGANMTFSWATPPQTKSRNTLKAPVLRRNMADSSWVPIAPLPHKAQRRGQPLQSEAPKVKTAPESTICGVHRKRSTTTGSGLLVGSNFLSLKRPSQGRPVQFTDALQCLAFSLQPFGRIARRDR
jgi:hypothetical protein